MEDKLDGIKIGLQLATFEHQRNSITFLKYFKQAHEHVFNVYDMSEVSKASIKNYLNKVYNLEQVYSDESIDYESYKDDSKDLTYSYRETIYVDRENGVLINISSESMSILSSDYLDKEVRDRVRKIQYTAFSNKTSNSVHVLAHGEDRGLYLSDFKISDEFLNLDIKANYNDDFLPIYDDLIANLDRDQVGLYLLHGTHGTGKTTLIRHIIRKVNKRLIFVSPSMATKFTEPSMIPFLMKYPDSIIIIEDSENIIKKREYGNDQSVSNLLNLSDGILGDCLKFQIICTFNTSKSEIDPALLRKGRLINSYEFGRLSVDKSNKLLEKLGYNQTEVPMRLSDIYNPASNQFNKDDKTPIGFSK